MHTQTAQDLREWAKGIYTIEAAVELLIRFQSGRFVAEGEPWIVVPREERRGNMRSGYWLDVDQLTVETTAALSGGERRVLALAASLAGGAPIDLSDAVSGLDRETLDLVLAAIAHAGGSHEHRVMGTRTFRNTQTGEPVEREWPSDEAMGSLHPWPTESDEAETKLRVVRGNHEQNADNDR